MCLYLGKSARLVSRYAESDFWQSSSCSSRYGSIVRSSSLPQHMATTPRVSAAWATICEHTQVIFGIHFLILFRATYMLCRCYDTYYPDQQQLQSTSLKL